MVSRSDFHKIGKRLLWSSLIALVFVAVISEVAFQVQKDKIARPPQSIELIIPSGTADLVASGSTVPSLPTDMDFLVGDTLVVHNQDQVDHQLGPVWVPPGTTGSLVLEQANKFSYACSFQPSRYLGVNVRQPTTLGTRLSALALAVPPTAMVLLVYSILIYPLEGRKQDSEQEKPTGRVQALDKSQATGGDGGQAS